MIKSRKFQGRINQSSYRRWYDHGRFYLLPESSPDPRFFAPQLTLSRNETPTPAICHTPRAYGSGVGGLFAVRIEPLTSNLVRQNQASRDSALYRRTSLSYRHSCGPFKRSVAVDGAFPRFSVQQHASVLPVSTAGRRSLVLTREMIRGKGAPRRLSGALLFRPFSWAKQEKGQGNGGR